MAAIPTKFVRVLATGHECLINASDFDPRLHAEVGGARRPAPIPAPMEQPPAAQPERFDETPGSIATVNVSVALDLIEQAESPEALAELERAERASVKQKGGRKSVLEAIKERRAALKKG
jgi:hypothetical protein